MNVDLYARLGRDLESQWHARKRKREIRDELGNIGGQDVCEELADVFKDGTAFLHRVDDAGEIVVEEDDI